VKRILLVLAALSWLVPAAFADHPSLTGIGLVATSSWANGGASGQLGLSLKLRQTPIFWGLHLSFASTYLGLGVSGDEYVVDRPLVHDKGFDLDWFLGLGGYAYLEASSIADFGLGARVPIGLSWHIDKQFELWLDLAPSLGISLNPLYFPDWSVPAELGFRAWIK